VTEQSSTQPAGAGVSDEEFADQVESQTSSDLEVEEKFEAEADGATSDTEAAKDPGGVGSPS
jgi:hypothetical protein